jgi:hypothetical protein
MIITNIDIDGISYTLDTVDRTAIIESINTGRPFTGISIPKMVTYISINYTVISIEQGAFQSCSELLNVSIALDSMITSIGQSAFHGCIKLLSINIPRYVTSISQLTFQGCTLLSSVTIPIDSMLTNIGIQAFTSCSSLSSIHIPNSVTVIGFGSFALCSALSSITIPSNVTNIGGFTFYSCSSLSSVYFLQTVTLPTIGANAFFNISTPSTAYYISTIDNANTLYSYGFTNIQEINSSDPSKPTNYNELLLALNDNQITNIYVQNDIQLGYGPLTVNELKILSNGSPSSSVSLFL